MLPNWIVILAYFLTLMLECYGRNLPMIDGVCGGGDWSSLKGSVASCAGSCCLRSLSGLGRAVL